MPNFTYDGFLTAASNAGLLGEFSQADLDTARKYPEFGYSILGLKQDIHKATTPEAKLLANEAANQLRSSYGGKIRCGLHLGREDPEPDRQRAGQDQRLRELHL